MTALGTVIGKGLHSARPAAGTAGALYYETDTTTLFRDNGASWDSVASNAAAGLADPMTTRGDVIVRNSSNATARLATGSANQYLGSDGTDTTFSAVTDAKLSTSDITTNNASTSKHGFVPKLPNDATKYYDGTGAYSVPGGGGGSGALTYLAQTVLGSDTASITVTAISGSYKDLIVVVSARSDTSADSTFLDLRVGSGSIDTGNNYGYAATITGTGPGGYGAASGLGFIQVGLCTANTSTAGAFAGTQFEILNYASTTQYRPILMRATLVGNSEYYWYHGGGVWRNASGAIDQVRVYPLAGNLKTGSQITIYGRT